MTTENINISIDIADDGTFSLFCPLPFAKTSLVPAGSTLAQAEAELQDMLREARADYEAEGHTWPQLAITYSWSARAFLAHHTQHFTLTGLAAITGVNASQLSHYLNGFKRPTPRTLHRIETAIRDFGAQLQHYALHPTTA